MTRCSISEASLSNLLPSLQKTLAVVLMLCIAQFSIAPLRATVQSRATPAALPAPDKTYGVKSAPLELEVYSDYQCPYCRAFYDGPLQQVIRYYVPSGKVYLVHHDFPMPMHKYSGEAARWANACAQVGQFGAAETALYDNQDAWGADGNIGKYLAAAMPASDFKRAQAIVNTGAMPAPQAHFPYAAPMIGVLRPCSVDPYIVQDIQLGYKILMPGTPAFVMSYKGRPLQPVYSAVSWPVLKQLFDALLAQ
jgi:protein-disulfide isomerase